jgi:hypothetical protein
VDDYFIYIGSSPVAEDCAQVGSDGFTERNIKECNAFINQLLRIWPDGDFRIRVEKGSDFGHYREVVAYYSTDEGSTDHRIAVAFKAEAQTPEYWDDEAKKELGL